MSNNIFGSNDKKSSEFESKVDTHSKAILTVTQRQKDIESSLENLHEKLEMIDHNSVKDFKKAFHEIKHLKDDILELKQDIKKITDFNSKITKQLKLLSPKDDVDKLEKYIDLWNPMNFVTREEMKNTQKETLEKLTKVLEKFLE